MELDQHDFGERSESILDAMLDLDIAALRKSLSSGADVNAPFDLLGVLYTPLKLAVHYDDQEFVQELLEFGADPNIETDGSSAFSLARENEYFDFVSMFNKIRDR